MISLFINWSLYVIFLSVVVYLVYLSLRKLNFRSSNRYLFLKIAFLTLPLQAMLFQLELPSYENQALKVSPSKRTVQVELPPIKIVSRNQSSQLSVDMWSAIGGSLFIIYLIGIFCGLFKLIQSYRVLSKLKKMGKPLVIDEAVVYVHSGSLAPAAFGSFNPCILMPAKLVEKLSDHDLQMVVCHEKGHIDRFDPVLNILRHLVRVLLFFNPITYKLSEIFEDEMELSLDEALLTTEKVVKKNYGGILVNLCSMDFLTESIVCNGLSQKLIKRRILNMKNFSKMRSSQRIIFFALGVVATAGILIPVLGLSIKTPSSKSSSKVIFDDVSLNLVNGGKRLIKVASPKSSVQMHKVNLDYFLVNLANTGGEKLIKVEMDFEVNSAGAKDEIEERMSQVRNIIVILLSSKDFKQISTPEGKQRLKDEVRDTVNSFLNKGAIEKVYFTRFIYS